MQQFQFKTKQLIQFFILWAALCFTGFMVNSSFAAPLLSHPLQQEPISEGQFYLSSGDNGTVGGVEFKDEDILFFDGQEWSLFIDMSAVGITQDVTAFTLLDNNDLLFSVNDNAEIPAVGTITPNDIVQFKPRATGAETAGEFSLFLRGADVGLDTPDEAIDALGLDGNGRLLISTKGKALIGQLAAGDEDLIVFSGTAFGSPTIGDWTMYFDGSDVGLTKSDEDITGVWVDRSSGDIYLTTKGIIQAGTLTGDAQDIVVFSPTITGFGTGGRFKSKPFFDGSTLSDDIGAIDGLAIGPQSMSKADSAELISEGTIIIENQIISGYGTNFIFDGDLGTFTMKHNRQRSYSGLKPDTYLVSQSNSPINWVLNEISCTDPDNGSSHMKKTAIIDLDAGETITCTFLHERGHWMPPVDDGRGTIYISTKGSGKLGDQPFSKMDILSYNPHTDSWFVYLQSADAGISENLNAFHVVPGSHILMSFDKPQTLPGIEAVVEPWDIVQFDLEDGAFSRYFNGFEAGLRDINASIDALSLTNDGHLIISTRGTAVLNGGNLQAKDEDLLLWDNELAEWRVYIDNSLSGFEGDTTALSIHGTQDKRLHLASDKNFVLDGSSGDSSDIFIMNVKTHGATAVGIFGLGIYFDGSALGLGNEAIDGLTISFP